MIVKWGLVISQARKLYLCVRLDDWGYHEERRLGRGLKESRSLRVVLNRAKGFELRGLNVSDWRTASQGLRKTKESRIEEVYVILIDQAELQLPAFIYPSSLYSVLSFSAAVSPTRYAVDWVWLLWFLVFWRMRYGFMMTFLLRQHWKNTEVHDP